MNMYSIRDIKAGVFFQPFFASHDIVAIRMFRAALNSKKSLIRDYPEDFALYRIGIWNEKNGKVMQDELAERLGYAYEYLEQEPVNKEEELLVFPPDNYAEEKEEKEGEDNDDEPG